MAVTAAQQRQAWEALRRSRQALEPLADSDGTTVRKRLPTGYSVTTATAELVRAGMDETAAAAAVHAAIISNARRFAASWRHYITGHGWFQELYQLEEAKRDEVVEACQLESFWQAAGEGRRPPTDLRTLTALTGKANAIHARRELPGSPIRFFLEQRHGLHPELALAVLRYGETVPWWAYFVLAIFGLICGWLFWLAIVDPQNTAFQNAGGVTVLHYTVVPLFAVLFLAADIWLIIDRPRRERAWREQLARFIESGSADPTSG